MFEIRDPQFIRRCDTCQVDVHWHLSVCPVCHRMLIGKRFSGCFPGALLYRGDIVPGATRFINYDLTKTDKADVLQHLAQEGWLEQAIHTVTTANFRVVISYDSKGECFLAFIYPLDDSNPYSGYSISARGSTAIKALAVVLWKHVVLYDGSWPKDNVGKKYPTDL